MQRLRPAVEERIRWAEHRVAWVRLVITLMGVLLYPWMARNTSSTMAAVLVLSGSFLYSLGTYFVSRLPDYPVLPLSYVVVVVDLGLTLSSVAVTGGVHSAVSPAIFLVVFSFAFRYPPRETLFGGLLAALGYLGVVAMLGQLPEFRTPAAVHVLYLSVAGLLGAFISREALSQRLEKRELADLLQSRLRLSEESSARVAAEEAVRARDELLSIASHELKTPLTAVTLDLEFLEQHVNADPLDRGALHYRSTRVSRGIHRLNRLIFNLLDVSRLVAGRLDLELSVIDLSSLVKDALSRANSQLSDSGCMVELSLTPGLVGTWDPLRVEQVIDNLLTNAVKYGAGKPIKICTQLEGADAVLQVIDQGIGIAPEDHQRIFERFERAVPSRQATGMGLGLWIARQIVEAMSGTISVKSRPGEGALFEVRFPLRSSARAGASVVARPRA